MSTRAAMNRGETRTERQNVTVNADSGNAFFLLPVQVPPRVENVGIVSPYFRNTRGRGNIAVNTGRDTHEQQKMAYRLYAQTEAMTL